MADAATANIDDALKAKLADYLSQLEASVKHGGSFVAEQVPDVLHQMVAYNLACSIVLVVTGLILLGLTAYGARWFNQRWDAIAKTGDNAAAMTLLIPLVVGVALIGANVSTMLKCWFAPKYFILEQIISLVK